MSTLAKNPNTRRKHHKVATGCLNCKRRRVKCDEGKPHCVRCIRANLLCEGYKIPKAKIFELAKPVVSSPSTASDAASIAREADSISISQRFTYSSSPISNTPDLRLVWQHGLLDAFMTIWIPDTLHKVPKTGPGARCIIPMSSWPVASFKLARQKHDSFTAHALLCLTLSLLGVRRNDHNLMKQAGVHYDRVLFHFQQQVSLLAQTGYSSKYADHVAALAAAGFCCSQVEYILQSWSNGDRHLNGMASLLEACGPACLQHEDTRRIFYDHCLLWISCSITHRRGSVYSHWPWMTSDWQHLMATCEPTQELITLGSQLPPLLEQVDACDQDVDPAEVEELVGKLLRLIEGLQAVTFTSMGLSELNDISRIPLDLRDRLWLGVVIAIGYTSAFIVDAAIAALQLTDLQSEYFVVEDEQTLLRNILDRHLHKLRATIEELAEVKHGMVAASGILHCIDAAWRGHAVLAKTSPSRHANVKQWFISLSDLVASRGYRPLREPWRSQEPIAEADIDWTKAEGLLPSSQIPSFGAMLTPLSSP